MKVELVELPEHSTDQMVTLLCNMLQSALGSASDLVKFTNGDAMSAALHLIVEVGLENSSPDQLRNDTIEALDSALADHLKTRGRAN